MSIEIVADVQELVPGETSSISVETRFADGSVSNVTTDPRVFVRSLDPDIASVSEAGVLSAIRIGDVTVRAVSFVGTDALGLVADLRLSIREVGDEDGDGILDSIELQFGLNPTFGGDAEADLDRDALSNREEIELGTDLRNPDSDGDWSPDGLEVARGTDPLVSDRPPDPEPPAKELDANCVVSLLNRSVRVRTDGTWGLANLPSSQGRVRVRATCVRNGEVRSGQSDLLDIPADGSLEAVEIRFDQAAPVPARLDLTAAIQRLTTAGQAIQLAALATLPDGSTSDRTLSETGTSYRTSNAGIVALSPDGLATAVSSGVALLSALNEGALGVLRVEVVLSGDADNDGMPDDWEVAHGLDPNDPADALSDADEDGLTALDEYTRGLDPRNPDSDADGLLDGEEVTLYGTDPALWDTDGDGVSDGLEVSSGSDPLDADSFNLAPILTSLVIRPDSFLLIVNTALGEGSRRLLVEGALVDGRSIDLTSSRYGTTYESSDLFVANFGTEDGRVYGGQEGLATITARNGALSAVSTVEVSIFSPRAISHLALPGYANSVAYVDGYAYVASGEAGLVVVDVSDLVSPSIASIVDTPGNANDVRLDGGFAYLADGANGVLVFQTDPSGIPVLVGQVAVPGVATDMAVDGSLLLVADELGVRSVDVANPFDPQLIGGVETPGRARGVDLAGSLAVVADSQDGIHVLDLGDPSAPVLLASTHLRPNGTSFAADVRLRGTTAYVADGAETALGGLKVLELRDPLAPAVVASTTETFGLENLALEGGLVLAADYLYRNAVPIFTDTRPEVQFSSLLDFLALSRRDDNGHGIDVADGVVFLAGTRDSTRDNGTVADSALHIGRYAVFGADGGVPPRVRVTEPQEGSVLSERNLIVLKATASDEIRIASVEFFVDGELVFTDFLTPYEAPYQVPTGVTTLEIRAAATDGGGNRTESEPISVNVVADQAPTVEIVAPVEGMAFTELSLVQVVVSASDDGPLERVEVFVDGISSGSKVKRPYTFLVTVPEGVSEFELSAAAYDESGPEFRSITLGVIPDLPPSAVIDSPLDGTEVLEGQPVRVAVFASDDVGMSRVELLEAGAGVDSDSDAPYEFYYIVPLGSSEVVLAARAIDGIGQTSTSQEIRLPVVFTDPLTTVIGAVTDTSGQPVDGATVTCLGVGPVGTDSSGAFAAVGVPTVSGDIRCRAVYVSPTGEEFSGASAPATPIQAGVTDVGIFALRAVPGVPYDGAQYVLGWGNSLAIGDLNGDGLLDLVGADWTFDTAAVISRLGRAQGGFEAPRVAAVVPDAERLALVDLNNDGALDVLGEDDASLFALLGDGQGSLAEPVRTFASNTFRRIASADFDNDGLTDVAVGMSVPTAMGGVQIFYGEGDGSFTPGLSYSFSSPIGDLETADIDGDGDADLAVLLWVANQVDAVEIWFGDGTGQFSLASSRALLNQRTSDLTLAYIDSDAFVDMAIGDDSSSSPDVELYFGFGTGSFLRGDRVIPGGAISAVRIRDLDSDGVQDVIVSLDDSDDKPVTYFLGRGSRNFETGTPIQLGTSQYDLQIGDFNGDSLADVAALTDGGMVAIALQDAPLEFDVDWRPFYSTGSSPTALVAGEFNSDAAPDLVTSSWLTDEVITLVSRQDGTFLPALFSPVDVSAFEVSAADLDGDGVEDLLLSDEGLGAVQVSAGQADGSFTTTLSLPVGQSPSNVAVGDLDQDGNLDLVVVNRGSDDLSVLLGAPGGGFLPESRVAVPGASPYRVVLGEFNGDGLPDLALADEGVSILLGNGDGSFQNRVPLEVPEDYFLTPFTVAVADFDRNGTDDVASTLAFDGENRAFALVFLGNGDGTFAATSPALASLLYAIAGDQLIAQDLNGDGYPDLATTYVDFPGGLIVLRGRGDGTFESPMRFATGCAPYDSAAADFDLNGLLDLATLDECDDGVTVLLHRE